MHHRAGYQGGRGTTEAPADPAGEALLEDAPRVLAAYSRSDLACLPITDAEPYELCVAVVADRRQQHLREFVSTAVATLSVGGEEVPGGDVHVGAVRHSGL
jgi:hypothetical protein